MDYAALATKLGGVPATPAGPSSASGTDFGALASKFGGSIITPDQSTNAGAATFQANDTKNPLEIGAKVVGNIPSSAVNFVKNTISFLNPYNTYKAAQNLGTALGDPNAPKVSVGDVLKEVPATIYHALTPQFLQHIFSGEYDKASQTIQNDPVGQILPLILIGRSAAEKAGVGEQFDAAVSKIASPVTKGAEAVANTAGRVGAQILGASTGAGASSVKQAYEGSPGFTDAMRGKIDPETLVNTAQDAVQNIVENRRQAYRTALGNLGEQKGSLDISPVSDTLDTQLKNFGIGVKDDGTLDFSRSSIANNGTARGDVQGVYDTLKTWGSQPGDRTALGLDTLKKQLSDFYSPSGSARALVQAVKSKVSGILNEQVPGYNEMTSDYQKASGLLDDIKSATGLGGKAKVDTVFTKLTSGMRSDNQLRLEILQQIESQGSQPDLMDKIAGTNMQSFIPKGIVGRGIDVGSAFAVLTHYFNPQMIPVLLGTSPRIVGEFVKALGWSAARTGSVMKIINSVGGKVPTSALGSVPVENLPPTGEQSQK